ncbi:hypothetical protein PV762_27760 [Mitsuaria sp. CC2]|uniref:hypothetical protein n=1 Tax=Mitsuaria sp. CC2 TaxID=3029186 RepID=UPI003B8DA512
MRLDWLPGWESSVLPQRLDEDFTVRRITAPGDIVLEAHAAPTGALTDAQRACHGALRIGRLVRRLAVDADGPTTGWQVLTRYAYGLEAPREGADPTALDLLGRKDALGHLWRYHYDTHLLTRYVDAAGGAWVLRWQGADVLFQSETAASEDTALSEEAAPDHRGSWSPLTSHWARAIHRCDGARAGTRVRC